MIGVPPTAGFLGKWFMLIGAVGTRQWFAVAVIVVSTLLNAGYFLPIVYSAFRKPEGDTAPATMKEAPWPMVVSLVATAVATVLLFIFPEVLFDLADSLMGGSATAPMAGGGTDG
jgi:multicomponent Na+:H+ antiporter subunit D